MLASGELLDLLNNGFGCEDPDYRSDHFWGSFGRGSQDMDQDGQGMHLGRNIQGDLVSQGHASAGSALRDPDRERLLTFIVWEVPHYLILVSLLMGFQTDKLRQLVGCEERLSNGSFPPPSPTPHQPASHHHLENR